MTREQRWILQELQPLRRYEDRRGLTPRQIARWRYREKMLTSILVIVSRAQAPRRKVKQ